jgi:nicotinamidase-related amidase
MPRVELSPQRSVLLVVDVQPSFMKAIWEADRVLDRSTFLIEIARLTDVPVLASTQNAARMGGSAPEIDPLVGEPVNKMSFSCAGSPQWMARLTALGRNQAVIVGIETHICVGQTADDLLTAGWEVVVCPDAVSARTPDRHKLGMERIRDAGAVPAHSEAVAYEWLGTAENPKFRQALELVKKSKF